MENPVGEVKKQTTKIPSKLKHEIKPNNSLSRFIQAMVGLKINLELRNETRITGVVSACKDDMSVSLTQVESIFGETVVQSEFMWINGRHIRFVDIDDRVNISSLLGYHEKYNMKQHQKRLEKQRRNLKRNKRQDADYDQRKQKFQLMEEAARAHQKTQKQLGKEKSETKQDEKDDLFRVKEHEDVKIEGEEFNEKQIESEDDIFDDDIFQEFS
jgi:small nuclear ribonucleoprotein (snRNP)-like protein